MHIVTGRHAREVVQSINECFRGIVQLIQCFECNKLPTLTVDQFVADIADFDSLPISTQSDLLAYYLVSNSTGNVVTAGPLASLREALHLRAHPHLAQYLSKQSRPAGRTLSHYVKTADGYVLERAYSKLLQATHTRRAAAKNISVSLRGALPGIGDPAVKSYLEEAIACFEQNLLRSALIMTWCVSFGLLRAWLYTNHLAKLNAVMATWKTPAQISKLGDFQDFVEATVLDTARKAKVISKEQLKTFKHLLDQRNSYAHPTAKSITPSIAEAYIETVLQEVLPHFG